MSVAGSLDQAAYARQRVLRGVDLGAPVEADEIGRYLAGSERAALLAGLTKTAAAEADRIIAEARSRAAALVATAEAELELARSAARAEGHIDGAESARRELEPVGQLLRTAVDAAEAIRRTMLAGAEDQVVALALTVARRVVGVAAEAHAALAAALAAEAVRSARADVLQVRIHPDDAPSVAIRLHAQASAVNVVADDSVELGGCIVDLANGTIDVQLSTQLAAIRTALVVDEDPGGWRRVPLSSGAEVGSKPKPVEP